MGWALAVAADEAVRAGAVAPGGTRQVPGEGRGALRHVPEPADVSDPGRVRAGDRVRRAGDAGVGRSGEVFEFAGDAAVFQVAVRVRTGFGQAAGDQYPYGGDRRGVHGRGDGAPV